MSQQPTRQSRQGRVTLKTELIKRVYPLKAILRGQEILLDLNRHRMLTNQQIADLHFQGRMNSHRKPYTPAGAKDAADRSVRRLWEAGYLERMMVYQTPTHSQTGKPVRAPVNMLSLEGARRVRVLLEELPAEGLRWTPRLRQFTDTTVDHLLEVNSVAIALRRSVGAAEGMTLYSWHDDDQLARAKDKHRFRGFIPDGFCIVEVITASGVKLVPLFLEVDRQTEMIRSRKNSDKDWYTKIMRYGEYFSLDYRSDPFYGVIGYSQDEVKSFDPPRVLTITTTPDRVERMIKATTEAGGRGTYLYTHKAVAHTDVWSLLGDIWRSPLLPANQCLSLEELLRN